MNRRPTPCELAVDRPRRGRLVGSGEHTRGMSRTLVPGEDTVIGRDPTCDVVVAPTAPGAEALLEFVSRYHAVLEADEHGHWSVYDNGSTNGTTLRSGDGATVRALTDSVSQSLEDGDVIELAHMRELSFTFRDNSLE